MKALWSDLHGWCRVTLGAMRLFLMGVLALLLVSCGGNSPGEQAGQDQTLAASVTVAATGLSVIGLEKISETRVGRTSFDYAFRVTLKNVGPAQGGVRVTLKAVGKGASIVQGTIDAGTIPADATVALPQLIVIRQDRSFPFNQPALQFEVTSTGPEDPGTGTQKAEATLLPSVRMLTASETQLITSTTATSITFSRDIALVPGTVFIANDTAYKSVASTSGSAGTVVTVAAPVLEEIFARIEIRGKYEITDAAGAPGAAAPMTRAATVGATANPPAKVTDTIQFSGEVAGSATISGSLEVDADYLYDKSLGGLQYANLTARADFDNTINIDVKAKAQLFEKFFKGKSFYIPIRLSLFDAALNAIGFRIAGIFIPTGAVVTGSTEFEASGTLTGNFSGTANGTYDKGVATSSFIPSGSVTFGVSGVNATGTAELSIDTGIYLHLRPALSALNTVALAGIDLRLGPRAELAVKAVPGATPPYCLNVEAFAHAEAFFFFKTIGTNIESDPGEFDRSVYKKPLIGTCLAPTTVQIVAMSAPSTPPVFGEQIDVDVQVLPQTGFEVPGKVPTGAVTIRSGTQSCKTVIQANGKGRCALRAGQAGPATVFDATYEGDKVYESSTISTNRNIQKARAFAALSAAPLTVVTNGTVAFNVVLGPLPDLGQALPTGSVNITTAAGSVLCTASLDAAGTGTCSAAMPAPGIIQVKADYLGDGNYLTTSSASVPVTVNAGTTLVSATLLVPDPQQNWTGLPATIQFMDISVVNKTSFQLAGNSATCGTGERGVPLYSAAVPAGAIFHAAATVTGVPYTSSGPGVNRRNCSSFVAVMMVPNPNNPAETKPRIWMNGTGRGQRFVGGGPTFDWESQVRYDSGDPWTGAGKSCVGGTVANSGFFGATWSSPNCSATLVY